ncbi:MULTISPECIES: helix-turn-helix domain-containing protein [unclassified Paenibacillus]|uniref:helix-turn-helix domain-containing protein n=1 Tax=unclassified Paenibacillus TaxID=185978 RepID=UPI0024059131|nr:MULTISPECIES: helix-turn-helix domain-containing protein [unclassified Paenibacillus]MDF9839797.1 AraC-like DNA-binding protein/ABC-type Fe3+-hydroxamate transport system substrate-binding protein [Paenibacillus sp. PastF-2]MDF9846378.1 AraC-like DNA-binding protein/ABC-type Fe3+-hydroxamate transport system substrate-binding protein [Paenibacillus sp. PastM-2]MDF9853273.1 AraC-like DNA-binding protein/ABC-type Fe3+-hydroxamate transport system substrate-binding protein [Paenibacillus sp. Pas
MMDIEQCKQAGTAPSVQYVLQSIRLIVADEQSEMGDLDGGDSNDKEGYELLIIMSGTEQGKCYLQGPGRPVSVDQEIMRCSYYRVCFAISGHDTASSLLPNKQELVCSPFAKTMELLDELYRLRGTSDELELFQRFVRFQELLLFLFRQNAPVDEDKGPDIERYGVELSIQHIHQYYQELLTVEELASLAGIDRWKYTRLFKEATGQVPLQYLNEVRINQAKMWLARADDKLLDIALNAGFNNEYYFNRRFKQTVGMSPGQYRRSRKGQLRVVAPYLEDFIVALGMQPIVQYWHAKWGKQDYLGLNHIPTFDENDDSFESLSGYKPDLILLMDRYEQQQYSQFRRISDTCILREQSSNWRTLLRTVADYFGRMELADDAIAKYDFKARTASHTLSQVMKGETVAFLRISADQIIQYTEEGQGFVSTVLYGDVGLRSHSAVGVALKANRPGMFNLSVEDLRTLTADHLFVTFDKWHSQAEGSERELLGQPEWCDLPAVRNNRVYEVDFLTWMNNGIISNSKKIDDILRSLA